MKELIDCTDLRKNKRVIAAWEGLTGRSAGEIHIWEGKTAAWVTYIPGSLADVAFEMRDACDPEKYREALEQVIRPGDTWIIYCKTVRVTRKQMIIAATLAWEKYNERTN